MTRNNIEQVSVRIPAELLKKMDTLKDKEGVDRTSVINRAVRYWVDVDGKVMTDNEYLNRISQLSENIENLKEKINDFIGSEKELKNEIREMRTLLSDQQKTIGRLIEILADDK